MFRSATTTASLSARPSSAMLQIKLFTKSRWPKFVKVTIGKPEKVRDRLAAFQRERYRYFISCVAICKYLLPMTWM